MTPVLLPKAEYFLSEDTETLNEINIQTFPLFKMLFVLSECDLSRVPVMAIY